MRTFDAALALAAGLAVATLACRGPGTERATLGRDSAGRGATGVVVDTAGPGGMSASGTDATIDSVDAELDTLVRIGPAHMELIVSRHVLIASNMLAGMAADLRRARVTGDAAWTATVDSVRQDITRMPGLSDQQLVPFLQAHTQLVHRLTQRYHALMNKAVPAAR